MVQTYRKESRLHPYCLFRVLEWLPMAQNYVFTQDDQMSPVYCIRCRSHIPRAVSNSNGGLCDDCLSHQRQAAQQAQAKASAAAVGLSACPHCHALKVQSIPQYESSAAISSSYIRAGLLLILLGVALFCCVWVVAIVMVGLGFLFIIIGFLTPSRHLVSTTYHCTACDARWVI